MTHRLVYLVRASMVAAFLVLVGNMPALAQSQQNTVGPEGAGEVLIPGIWIDPDGCEHWVMDDGWEGYMSPVVLPNGRPVCGRDPAKAPPCGVVSDQFFATDSAEMSPAAKAEVARFFKNNKNRNFIIEGHTDSRASHAYNQTLSQNRAIAVANVAMSIGIRPTRVLGKGETEPRASNNTAAGMAANRRVEIICVQ